MKKLDLGPKGKKRGKDLAQKKCVVLAPLKSLQEKKQESKRLMKSAKWSLKKREGKMRKKKKTKLSKMSQKISITFSISSKIN
jgi:hypothetical protein